MLYKCTVFSISLLLHIHIYNVSLSPPFLYKSVEKEPSSLPNWQLFSWKMAKMTLCLQNQLNLHHSHREQRQMLTLHFSVDSICTGSTRARLFCLAYMVITSHLFIYEGVNQLYCDSRTVGIDADAHGQNKTNCTQLVFSGHQWKKVLSLRGGLFLPVEVWWEVCPLSDSRQVTLPPVVCPVDVRVCLRGVTLSPSHINCAFHLHFTESLQTLTV